MTIESVKSLLREYGVVGAGGAGFPTYAKLSDKADTYILNCAECEPLLKLHRQLLEEHTREILSAMRAVMKAIGAERGIVAIKKHYTSTVEAVEAEIGDFPELEIKLMSAVYPSGDELLLIRNMTGRVVAPGALPISVGVIVNNVETVYNVWRALNGAPVTHKYVTVAGEVAEPKTLLAPLGISLSDLVKSAGGATVEDPAYLVGGPMMGTVKSGRDAVTKTTNAVILLPGNHQVILGRRLKSGIMLRRAMSACCQCHSCTDLCSRHAVGYPIEPHMIMRILSNGGHGDRKAVLGSFSCSGCGICETYACPQGLSPRLLIAELKAQAKKMGISAPEGVSTGEPVRDEKLHRVSTSRLCSRLGLKKYDVPAPMSEDVPVCKRVRVPLDRFIGAPAKPCVNVGDDVKVGDAVGCACERALSVNVHASVDGRVSAVTDRFIEIACR
ncbi:MAG: SLBB domain-containing protein [Clostridia bacterium]|nr:SLBB domain-containing protein [Clostridia bacterium]